MKKYLFLSAIIILSLLIIILRRPEALTDAQFYAEDGIYWYKQAYDLGPLKPFLIPINGYYQTLSRIGGAIAQIFPLKYAPLIFNLIAVFMQLLPVLIFISAGFKKIIPNAYARAFLLLSYLMLPNIGEVYINLTNAQWFLALSALLALLFLPGAKYFWQKVFIFTLMGLSGPLSIMLLPVAFLYFKKAMNKTNVILFGIIFGGSIIQFITLIKSGQRTAAFPTDFSPTLLFGIFYKQIIIGSVLGPNGFQWIQNNIPLSQYFLNVAGLLALVVIIYCLKKGPREIKLMIVFAFLVFFSSLISPVLGPTVKSPLKFLFMEWNTRYWLIPMMTFLFCLTWTISDKKADKVMKFISIFFILSMILFQVKNYRHYHNFRFSSQKNMNFEKYTEQFNKLKKGEEIVIPIYPPEDRWRLYLIKN